VTSLVFSGDGKTLASVSKEGIITWNVGKKITPLLVCPTEGIPHAMALSPDGASLALVIGYNPVKVGPGGNVAPDPNSWVELQLWNLRNGKTCALVPRRHTKEPDALDHLAFSPDGKTLALRRIVRPEMDPQGIEVWDLANNTRRFTVPPGPYAFFP